MSYFLESFEFDNSMDNQIDNNVEVSDEELEAEYGEASKEFFPYEPTSEGAEAIAATLEEDFNLIMEEDAIDQLGYAIRNHRAMSVEEASVNLSDIKTKLKAAINKFVAKTKVLVGKFLALVGRYVNTNASFIKRYESRIMNGDASGIDYKGYNFTIESFTNGIYNKISAIAATGAMTMRDNEMADEASVMRGEILGLSVDLSRSAFSKELFKVLRDGKTEKETVKINKQEIVNTIKNAKNDKKSANDVYKKTKEACNKLLKVAKDIKSNAKEIKADNDRKVMTDIADSGIKSAKTALTILSTVNGAVLTAIRARLSQSKAIAVKLVQSSVDKSASSNKPAVKNESSMFI